MARSSFETSLGMSRRLSPATWFEVRVLFINQDPKGDIAKNYPFHFLRYLGSSSDPSARATSDY